MTDKVQLIKKEIERIKVKEDNSITPDQAKHHTHYHVGRRELCDTLLQFIDSLPEEPASEDLDFQTFAKEMDAVFALSSSETENTEESPLNWEYAIARHFAEWQRQQMKETLQAEYEKGRFDMREEMMKDAVEGVINIRKWPAKAQVEFYDRLPVFNVRTGDKVKIIIVKTE